MQMSELKFNDQGLIPCIVQDADTLEVLMMAWMNEESLRKTLEMGETVFWSRSRQEIWHKGGTSGNVQRLVSLSYDCDADTLLAKVHPAGPACHTGERSCFYRELT
ncbi:MAG: phosphoribosyl-AMP cyclohydrolase [Eggerthellaceae bacterium]|nr:phosphoribosyl-AMP cyclohydrolase [Eggerthellaceae bacterium]